MIPFISSHLIKMTNISSKSSHCAPPLLRAFNLSNQPFSHLQINKVAIFNDHRPIILTKSPSFPPHSFLPQNPHVGRFPSATVSALSLMQMWREMEAEAGFCPALHTCVKESESSTAAGFSDITVNAPAAALLPLPNINGEVEEERRREVARFPFHSRIQSLIRLKSLRQAVATIRHQQWSQKLEAEILETISNNFILRERLEDKIQYDMNEIPIEESMIVMKVQPSNSNVFVFAIPFGHFDSENNHFPELVSIREIESSSQAFYSPQAFLTLPSQCEDQQENQSFDASWEERSLMGSSLDWQRASDSHMLQTWHCVIASDGTKTSTQEQYVVSDECNWLLQPYNIRRGWG